MTTATLAAPVGTSAFPEPLAIAASAVNDPDGESLYEVVDGQVVEKPPMASNSIHLCGVFHGWVFPFARQHQLGRAESEMMYLLNPTTGLKRRPDFSFVSYARWPKETPLPEDDGWNVIPDLAVEVVSPSNSAEEMKRKIAEYFTAGVRLVWVAYPTLGLIETYDSPTSVQILDRSGTLDGGTVLPGFRLALTDLFEDAIA